MDTVAMFAAIAWHRLALCDQAEGFSPEQWSTDSLCAGWRVRDVMGHLVSLQEVPTWKLIVGVFGMSGFHRRADRFALEFGRQEPARLVSSYRAVASSRKTPPFIGPIAPLTDVLVHALDIQRPLGLPPTARDDAAGIVLTALCRGLPGFTPKRLGRGLRFEATDLDWNTGDGPTVRATASDILLALNGRHVPDSAFDGDGAAELMARLSASR